MKLGPKIDRFLEQYRLSQQELARSANVPQTNLSRLRVEGGEENLRVDYAFRIARRMGVPLDWLADPEADWPPPQATGSGDGLGGEERLILLLARQVGLEVARRRLLRLPDSEPPGPAAGVAEAGEEAAGGPPSGKGAEGPNCEASGPRKVRGRTP